MLKHKTQKADAAQSAASAFWVLVCLNASGAAIKPKSNFYLSPKRYKPA
jgi:hypothetical protein